MPQARSWFLEGVIDCEALERWVRENNFHKSKNETDLAGAQIEMFIADWLMAALSEGVEPGHSGVVYVRAGGGGPLGHPRVFLNLGRDGKVECPYCSRLFVNRAMQGSASGDATTLSRVSEERNV